MGFLVLCSATYIIEERGPGSVSITQSSLIFCVFLLNAIPILFHIHFYLVSLLERVSQKPFELSLKMALVAFNTLSKVCSIVCRIKRGVRSLIAK